MDWATVYTPKVRRISTAVFFTLWPLLNGNKSILCYKAVTNIDRYMERMAAAKSRNRFGYFPDPIENDPRAQSSQEKTSAFRHCVLSMARAPLSLSSSISMCFAAITGSIVHAGSELPISLVKLS